MGYRCDSCDHRYAENGEPKHSGHLSVFRDTETGVAFCAECVSVYASWLLDGGMEAEPDMYHWMRDAVAVAP